MKLQERVSYLDSPDSSLKSHLIETRDLSCNYAKIMPGSESSVSPLSNAPNPAGCHFSIYFQEGE